MVVDDADFDLAAGMRPDEGREGGVVFSVVGVGVVVFLRHGMGH